MAVPTMIFFSSALRRYARLDRVAVLKKPFFSDGFDQPGFVGVLLGLLLGRIVLAELLVPVEQCGGHGQSFSCPRSSIANPSCPDGDRNRYDQGQQNDRNLKASQAPDVPGRFTTAGRDRVDRQQDDQRRAGHRSKAQRLLPNPYRRVPASSPSAPTSGRLRPGSLGHVGHRKETAGSRFPERTCRCPSQVAGP